MSKRWAVLILALLAGLALSHPFCEFKPLRTKRREMRRGKWNNIPPRKPCVRREKVRPAPRRDLSGIWDAAGLDGGLQVNGAAEHPALLPQKGGRPEGGREAGAGAEGGQPDETGIEHPLPYTPDGLAALKANKPSGPGVRQVPAALSNDPLDQCDPIGFPRMELYELRTIELASDCQPGGLLKSIVRQLPRHLDGWARTPQGPGPAVERLLGRQMGGRLHVRGRDGRAESKKLARSRRPSAQRCFAGGGTLSPRGP